MHKRRVHIVILALLIFVTSYLPANVFGSSEVSVLVNNCILEFNSGGPTLSNGTLMVPAKEYITSLGGEFSYDAAKQTGTIKAGGNELVFRLDDSVACFNGKFIQASEPMRIMSNRFMIPASFTVSYLGAESFMSLKRNMLMVYQPSEGKITYNVLSGDTLWAISQLFGTTVSSLKQLNNLSSDTIQTGQKLVVKETAFTPAVLPAYTTAGATMRTGPGFEYGVAGYLKASVDLSVTGKTSDWYRVDTTKGSGYIYRTVIGMKQEYIFSTNLSRFFDNVIPVDTSLDTLAYQDYTVQKGDYIWALSQKFGVPDKELMTANGFSSSTVININQVIRIPVHVIAVKNVPGSDFGEVLDWFSQGQYVFTTGKTGRLIDPVTGKSFNIKRTIGANHSDTETLTEEDSKVMKELFGGTWNWGRKQFILEVDGRRLAVSAAGMPHAGVDGVPFLQNIANRSDNYGTGPNYDAISGNGMDGHFDLYFLNSLKHVDGKVDATHQYNVLMSGGLQ